MTSVVFQRSAAKSRARSALLRKLRGWAVLAALCCCTALAGCADGARAYTLSTAAMDTIVEQRAYGPGAVEAMRRVNAAVAGWDETFSLFSQSGDIARINAAAGKAPVEVLPQTAALLRQARRLTPQSDGAFAITIAPLTLAWGITGSAPRVPGGGELAALLPLVNDAALEIDGRLVRLPNAGMCLDLGGIAKGAFCAVAQEIYRECGVDSACLWIGGNTYVRGVKPTGEKYRIGFSSAGTSPDATVASFTMQDEVVAVSGGYERYFEAGGRRYIHIIDPRTGRPVQSDIVSVGVVSADGAEADFWSTTLFVWGRERAVEQMRAGAKALLLDSEGTLYVSAALREGFELHGEDVKVVFVDIVANAGPVRDE